MSKGCREFTQCDHCENPDFSVFSHLSSEDRSFLDSGKLFCEYKKGETIFKEGQYPTGLLCLNNGKVKLFRGGIGGKEQIIRLVKPVEFFGYRSLLAEEPHQTTAVAITPSTICHIDKDRILKIIRKDSELAYKLIQRLTRELGFANSRIVNLTQKHVRGRLAEALLLMENMYGTDNNGYLEVVLGRSDLASLSNMTVSNASRTLTSFAIEKLIEINGKKIKIMDKDRLIKINNIG